MQRGEETVTIWYWNLGLRHLDGRTVHTDHKVT